MCVIHFYAQRQKNISPQHVNKSNIEKDDTYKHSINVPSAAALQIETVSMA